MSSNIIDSNIVRSNDLIRSYRMAASAVLKHDLMGDGIPGAKEALVPMHPMDIITVNPTIQEYFVENSGDSGLLQSVTMFHYEQLGRAIALLPVISLVGVEDTRTTKTYTLRRSDGLTVKAMYRKGTNQALCFMEADGRWVTGKLNQRAFRVIQQERDARGDDNLIAWSKYHFAGWLLANPKLSVNLIAGDGKLEAAQFEVYYGWLLQTWKNAGIATKHFPYLSYAQSVGEGLVIDQLLETIEIA